MRCEALEWALELQRRLLAVAWPEALLHQPELAPQYNKALTAMLWRGPRAQANPYADFCVAPYVYALACGVCINGCR